MKSAIGYVEVKMQSGTYDCGLFSMAFATPMVLGWNPVHLIPVLPGRDENTSVEMPNKWKDDKVPNQNEEEHKKKQ